MIWPFKTINLLSLSPIITVITNVQVRHEQIRYDDVNRSDMKHATNDHKIDEHDQFDNDMSENRTRDSTNVDEGDIWPPEVWNQQSSESSYALKNLCQSRHSSGGHDQMHSVKNDTYLKQHSAYFDFDGDGIIWPWDTYRGCRNFGWGRFLSALAAFLINFNLSYFSLPHWTPDLRFPIYIENVHRNKHGSSSLSYDNQGQFREQMFDDFFLRYDKGEKGGLDKYDLVRAIYGQRMVFDFFGLSATILEWLATYLLIWPEDGIIRKDDVRMVFDGSMFQSKANTSKQKRGYDVVKSKAT